MEVVEWRPRLRAHNTRGKHMNGQKQSEKVQVSASCMRLTQTVRVDEQLESMNEKSFFEDGSSRLAGYGEKI